MNIYLTITLFVLLIFFLILAYVMKSSVFAILSFVILVIIIYELVNTGIEFNAGTNKTITKVNDNLTYEGTTDRFEKINPTWNNYLIAAFSIFALYLLLSIITKESEE